MVWHMILVTSKPVAYHIQTVDTVKERCCEHPMVGAQPNESDVVSWSYVLPGLIRQRASNVVTGTLSEGHFDRTRTDP
jgi:hypothetical protein